MFPLSQRRKCPSVVRGLLHMLTIHIIWTWDPSFSISSRRLSLLKHVLFDNRIISTYRLGQGGSSKST